MLTIQVILGSVRQGRQGEKVARWAVAQAAGQEHMQIELLDLKDYPLPFYAEPMSPAFLKGNYSFDAAKQWVTKIAQADGYIVVTPEYNHGYPAVLKNALDYGYIEWNKKPIAFVSYAGSNVGGSRAVEQLRLVAIELQMAPIREGVHLAGIRQLFEEDGTIKDPTYAQRFGSMLQQLAWWAKALQAARIMGDI